MNPFQVLLCAPLTIRQMIWSWVKHEIGFEFSCSFLFAACLWVFGWAQPSISKRICKMDLIYAWSIMVAFVFLSLCVWEDGDGIWEDGQGYTVYAVWEDAPTPKNVLRNHQPLSRSIHQFASILDIIPVADRRMLLGIKKTYMAKYTALQEEKKAGLNQKYFIARKVILSHEFIKELNQVFDQVHFKETAWCSNCCQYCHVSPRSRPEFRKARWCEIAGVTCSPWSSMNANSPGVFDDATLVELAWAHRQLLFAIAFSLKVWAWFEVLFLSPPASFWERLSQDGSVVCAWAPGRE